MAFLAFADAKSEALMERPQRALYLYGHENEMYNVGVEVKERECL